MVGRSTIADSSWSAEPYERCTIARMVAGRLFVGAVGVVV